MFLILSRSVCITKFLASLLCVWRVLDGGYHCWESDDEMWGASRMWYSINEILIITLFLTIFLTYNCVTTHRLACHHIWQIFIGQFERFLRRISGIIFFCHSRFVLLLQGVLVEPSWSEGCLKILPVVVMISLLWGPTWLYCLILQVTDGGDDEFIYQSSCWCSSSSSSFLLFSLFSSFMWMLF